MLRPNISRARTRGLRSLSRGWMARRAPCWSPPLRDTEIIKPAERHPNARSGCRACQLSWIAARFAIAAYCGASAGMNTLAK